MSQFTRSTIGSSPVGPFVATLTGNDAVIVPADGANNINVKGDGLNITTSGNAGTHTLTISLINSTDITTTTTDNSVKAAYTLATVNNKAYGIFVRAVGAYADYSQAIVVAVSTVGLNDAGVTTVFDKQGTITTTGGFPPGPVNPYGISFTISGTSIVVNVTGVAATNMNWTLNIQYYTA